VSGKSSCASATKVSISSLIALPDLFSHDVHRGVEDNLVAPHRDEGQVAGPQPANAGTKFRAASCSGGACGSLQNRDGVNRTPPSAVNEIPPGPLRDSSQAKRTAELRQGLRIYGIQSYKSDNRLSVHARTAAPLAMASGVEYSSGR
jgi:hypothetical protein